MACIPTPNMVRHGTCRHNYTVETGLVVGLLYWNERFELYIGLGSVLTNVSLRRKVATNNMLLFIEAHTNLPMHADVFEHPTPWLASQHPIWSVMAPVDTTTQWREDWSSASVVNHSTVIDCIIRQPGFDLSLVTRGLCSTVSRHVKAHVMLIYTNGVLSNHLPVIVASDRPCTA